MRQLWGALAVLLVLTGCTTERVGGEARRTDAPTGPTELRVPVEFARVSPSATATTVELPDPEGTTLHVEEPFLTVTRLEKAEATLEPNAANWSLLITLTEEDGAVFSRWTEEHTGEQAAVLVDDEVVFAPSIQSPIPGREIAITAQYTRVEAEALLHDLTGR